MSVYTDPQLTHLNRKMSLFPTTPAPGARVRVPDGSEGKFESVADVYQGGDCEADQALVTIPGIGRRVFALSDLEVL